jgi:hypothetical protein
MTETLTAADRAVLRRAAAQWRLPNTTIGERLRKAYERFGILRDRKGRVAGFGRDGFTLTPQCAALHGWADECHRQRQINWR